MSRAMCVTALLAAAALTVQLEPTTRAQTANRTYDWCVKGNNDRRVRYCEEREQTIGRDAALDVDPGRNGGIQIRGRSEPDIQLRTRISAYAPTEARETGASRCVTSAVTSRATLATAAFGSS